MARTVSVAPDAPERNVAPGQGEATARQRDLAADAAAFLHQSEADVDRDDDYGPIHPSAHGRGAHESDEITALDDDVHFEFADFEFDGTKLKAPPERDGFVQRWLKVEFRDGTPNAQAESLARRRGWIPRAASTISDEAWQPMGSMASDSGDGFIRVGGLLLVERPVKVHDAFRRHYKGRALRLAESVDRGLAEVSRNQRVSIKKASQVQVFGG